MPTASLMTEEISGPNLNITRGSLRWRSCYLVAGVIVHEIRNHMAHEYGSFSAGGMTCQRYCNRSLTLNGSIHWGWFFRKGMQGLDQELDPILIEEGQPSQANH